MLLGEEVGKRLHVGEYNARAVVSGFQGHQNGNGVPMVAYLNPYSSSPPVHPVSSPYARHDGQTR
jgi:hypothetical protein